LTGSAGFQRLVDTARQFAVFLGVGGIVVIEVHQKTGKIGAVFSVHAVNQLFRRDALFLGPQHDGRAMCIIGTDVIHIMALHLQETHPDVGLDIFHQMAEMDAAIGIRQCRGDEDFAWLNVGH